MVRFFNSEMRFRDDEEVNEIIPVIRQLSSVSPKHREQFFEEVAKCRRRLLHGWNTSTLSQVFLYESADDLLRFRSMSAKVREKLKLIQGMRDSFHLPIGLGHSSLLSYFKQIDTDNDGLIHSSDLLEIFTKKLRVGLEESEMKELLMHVCKENKGWMSYRQFFNHFSVNLGARSQVRVQSLSFLISCQHVRVQPVKSEKKKVIVIPTVHNKTKELAESSNDVSTKPSHREFRGTAFIGQLMMCSGADLLVGADNLIYTTVGYIF